MWRYYYQAVESNKYTNRAAYRLVNVLYGVGWLAILLLVLFVFFATKPYTYVDDTKSYVTCLTNNKKYGFANFQQPTGQYLSSLEDKGNYLCSMVIKASLKYQEANSSNLFQRQAWSEHEQKWFPDTPQNNQILVQNVKNQYPQGFFKITEVQSTNSSWQNVLLWCAGTFAVLAIILDLMRFTILYIAAGKKFHLNDFIVFRLFNN